ncbi:hypothetical protein QEN19_000780 [Hanseniaspora menglaensis]
MKKSTRSIRKIIDFTSLFLLAGATLLAFFVILCGGKKTGLLSKFYWLKADTSGIPNAPSETYWLNYMYCGKGDNSSNYQSCSGKKPAYPFSPKNNFRTTVNVPSAFIDDRDKYYYLSRVGWSMWLVGLVFLVLSFAPIIASICVVVPKIHIASTVLIWSAWFYLTLGACLWTSAFALGKNAFTDAGRSAHLGVKMFAFIWTTVFILTITSIWQPISGFMAKKYKNDINRQNSEFGVTKYANNNTTGELEGAANGIDSDSDSYLNNNAGANAAYNDFSKSAAAQVNTNADGEGHENIGILNVPFQNASTKEETFTATTATDSLDQKDYDTFNDSTDLHIGSKGTENLAEGDFKTSKVVETSKKVAEADGTVTDYYKKQYTDYTT